MSHKVRLADPCCFIGAKVFLKSSTSILPIDKSSERDLNRWVTRYDEQLDAYCIFTLGSGNRLVARRNLLRSISKLEIEIRVQSSNNDDLPLLHDYDSKYVGLPVVHPNNPSLRGTVLYYLPYEDLYNVVFTDMSTANINENEIIDSLILTVQGKELNHLERSHHIDGNDKIQTEKKDDSIVKNLNGKRKRKRNTADNIKRDSPHEIINVDFEDVDSETTSINSPENNADIQLKRPKVINLGENSTDIKLPAEEESESIRNGYIIESPDYVPVVPLESRKAAYEIVRRELNRIANDIPMGQGKTPMLEKILRNSDLKDRSALTRFVDSRGLFLLNTLLQSQIQEVRTKRTIQSFNDLLHTIKIIAMLPTPSEKQLRESEIALTIGMIIRLKLLDVDATQDPSLHINEIKLPRMIPHMAKWVKYKWLTNMTKLSKMEEQQYRKPAKAARKSAHTPQRFVDEVHRGKKSMDDQKKSAKSFIASTSASTNQIPKIKQSSGLKPDWMRRNEDLSRTRFTIKTNPEAEFLHYRERQHQQASSIGNSQGNIKANTSDSANYAMSERNGGVRGVYGRNQKLSIAPRHRSIMFWRDTPPSALQKQSAPSYSLGKSSVNRNRGQQRSYRLRSILRPVSKYQDNLKPF